MSTQPSLIYKIATAKLYVEARPSGRFSGMPVDLADGYMHFSTADQLAETLRKHFAGQTDLVLIAVRIEDVAADLKWEISRGDALFPHLYAPLLLEAVAWSVPLALNTDGTHVLPEDIQ